MNKRCGARLRRCWLKAPMDIGLCFCGWNVFWALRILELVKNISERDIKMKTHSDLCMAEWTWVQRASFPIHTNTNSTYAHATSLDSCDWAYWRHAKKYNNSNWQERTANVISIIYPPCFTLSRDCPFITSMGSYFLSINFFSDVSLKAP